MSRDDNTSAASGRRSVRSSSTLSSKQTIEWGNDVSIGSCSPSGTIVIFGSKDSLVLFELESRNWRHKLVWLFFYYQICTLILKLYSFHKKTVELKGSLLITGLCWSIDGTRLAVSTLNGAIEMFQCRWRTKLYGNRFEINYIGNRQLMIKDLQTNNSALFNTNWDVQDVKIIKESFTVIWTTNTLIMGSLSNVKQRSEIEWIGLTTHGIRFSFDYENVALISAIGELFLVELGQNKILGSVRTDFVSPHLIR